MTAGLCECGCGRTTNAHATSDASKGHVKGQHYRFLAGHNAKSDALDRLGVAGRTGAADARNGRPRRIDIADTSPIGQRYTRGYDAPDAWRDQ